MSLEERLLVLPTGREIPLDKIAAKQNLSEDQVEKEIMALIKRDPTLGNLDVFSGVFIRGGFVMPDPDLSLGDAISELQSAFVDWEAVSQLDDAVKKASAAENLVQRAADILALVGKAAGLADGYRWSDIDVTTLSSEEKNALKQAFNLLMTKKKDTAALGDGGLWFRAGIVAHKLEWLPEAEAFYQASVAQQKDLVGSWVNLGAVRKEQGNLKGALEAMQNAVEADPTYAMAWKGLGEIQQALGNLPAALESMKKATKIEPTDEAVWVSLGLACEEAEDFPSAIEAYRQALFANASKPAGWLGLGSGYQAADDYEKAMYCFERSLVFPGARSAAADLLAEYRKPEYGLKPQRPFTDSELEEITRNARIRGVFIRMGANDPSAWAILGILYLDLKLWGKALGALSKANSMAGSEDLGDVDGLIAAIQKEGIPPEDPFTEDERKKIRMMLGFKD